MTQQRKHTRRAFLGTVGVGGLLGATGIPTTIADVGTIQETWTLGTSAEGSSSWRIGVNWTEFFGREDLWDDVGVEVEAVVTEGTTATYRRVDAGEMELGGSTTQLLEDSPDEGPPFDEEPLTNFDQIRQIRAYMNFNNFGVVNLDAGVETWEDLEGRPVAISSIGSGTRPAKELIVEQEIGLENIDERFMEFADIPGALRGGVVDAAFTWTTNQVVPIGFAEEIDATVDWAPLELSDETIEFLDEEVPFSSFMRLDEDLVGEMFETYQGPLDTFTLTYPYVAFAERDPEVIREITRLTYETGEELVEEDSIMGLFPDEERFLDMHPDVPLHLGAWEYYEEQFEDFPEDYDLTPPPELE